jgi:hypothetical protein
MDKIASPHLNCRLSPPESQAFVHTHHGLCKIIEQNVRLPWQSRTSFRTRKGEQHIVLTNLNKASLKQLINSHQTNEGVTLSSRSFGDSFWLCFFQDFCYFVYCRRMKGNWQKNIYSNFMQSISSYIVEKHIKRRRLPMAGNSESCCANSFFGLFHCGLGCQKWGITKNIHMCHLKPA